MKRFLKCALLTFVVIFTVSSTCQSETKETFDYLLYDDLLKQYVWDGQVDYISWKKNDLVTFENYLFSLRNISLEGFSDNERKAFWINAYNAFTLYGVLQRIPSSAFFAKLFSVQVVPGFFSRIVYKVAGQDLTLDNIEHDKLRGEFGDARIHFAIVCASGSCPKLQSRVFFAKNLDERLDEATRLFLADETRNKIDKNRDVLNLSSLFSWYEGDFVEDSGSILEYVKKYLSSEDADYVSKNKVKIKYLYYDWLVNIKK
ncbi:DUF547 domain-containing protein [Thermoproteota archaeon]